MSFLEEEGMNKRMIDKKAFLKIMDCISQQHAKEATLSAVISDCFDNMVSINDNKNLDALIMLARATFDPDELIYWFEFDHATFEIGANGDKAILDTPEKLYDYLDNEYSVENKMISRELFKEILRLLEDQSETNRKLGKAFEDYAESCYIVIEDKYHGALMLMIKSTFDFGEMLEYWLYEDCKKITVDGVEIDIAKVDALYDCICNEFKECGGKPYLPRNDEIVKTIMQDELVELMKKQILSGGGKHQ